MFALALLEKLGTLRARAAAWHPVMLVAPWRRRHATALMAVAVAGDVAAVVLLALSPPAGAAVAAALLTAYSVLALPAHAGASGGCRCFWRVLNTSTRAGLLGRNAALAAFAGLVLVRSPSGPSGAGLAVGVVVILVLLGVVALLERASRAGGRPLPQIETKGGIAR